MAWNSRNERDERRRVIIPPPGDLSDHGPSSLMRYFLQAGGWSQGEFAVEISKHHRVRTMSVDSVSQWTNHDVLPKTYRVQMIKVIEASVDRDFVWAWLQAFHTVWSAHSSTKVRRVNFRGRGKAASRARPEASANSIAAPSCKTRHSGTF